MEVKYIENMTDGEIAEAMVRGEIVGPVVTNNCFLINIRITGTGLTPRTYGKVTRTFNRPPGVFLSDKFLDMCNGLPCAYYNTEIGHPTDGELDYDNFKNYIVGSVMLAYVKGEEVWGIARIFNLDLLQAILDGKVLSTSPYVTSRSLEGRDGVIDEKLDDLNHVAFVQAGHWDQKEVGPAMLIGEVMYKKDPVQAALEEADKKDGGWPVDKNGWPDGDDLKVGDPVTINNKKGRITGMTAVGAGPKWPIVTFDDGTVDDIDPKKIKKDMTFSQGKNLIHKEGGYANASSLAATNAIDADELAGSLGLNAKYLFGKYILPNEFFVASCEKS